MPWGGVGWRHYTETHYFARDFDFRAAHNNNPAIGTHTQGAQWYVCATRYSTVSRGTTCLRTLLMTHAASSRCIYFCSNLRALRQCSVPAGIEMGVDVCLPCGRQVGCGEPSLTRHIYIYRTAAPLHSWGEIAQPPQDCVRGRGSSLPPYRELQQQ